MRCVLTTWLLALLIVCGVAVAAIEDDSRWPRFIRDPNAQVCLGVPLIDDLKDGTATIRCVYRLVLTPQDGAASKPIWGVVTLTASARRDADRRCVHFNDFKVAALSAATMDAADAPMASQWLTTVLSMAPLMIDERELLASLPDHTLPAAKDAGEGSLEEREAALLACLPVLPALPALPVLPAPAADATAAPASQRCTDESFGDPYVGRGNWIHRLREGRWERWSPEHGWVDAHIALEFPAGAPWSMQKDTFELLRARAAATTAGMRRDPRTLEDARARRFEASLRTASQTVSTTQTLFRAPVFPE
ncbi:MAG: hypothetical protein O2819_08120 [Planctomycetota bacterium]|nr:hypothetical protein [Planctomycetota bacterium]MDA1106554.1 hypothetical protein [Planctomycetota bacterium]